MNQLEKLEKNLVKLRLFRGFFSGFKNWMLSIRMTVSDTEYQFLTVSVSRQRLFRKIRLVFYKSSYIFYLSFPPIFLNWKIIVIFQLSSNAIDPSPLNVEDCHTVLTNWDL